jgi:hypothetical protein
MKEKDETSKEITKASWIKHPTGIQLLLNFWYIICIITNTVNWLSRPTTKELIHELILLFILYFGFRIGNYLEEDAFKSKALDNEETSAIFTVIFWISGIIYLFNIW